VGASILVIHSKREQQGATGSQPDDYFEFDWELSLMHDMYGRDRARERGRGERQRGERDTQTQDRKT